MILLGLKHSKLIILEVFEDFVYFNKFGKLGPQLFSIDTKYSGNSGKFEISKTLLRYSSSLSIIQLIIQML